MLSRYRRVDDLIDDIRSLGTASDAAVHALVGAAAVDDRAVATLVVALLPLSLSRCAGSAIGSTS